MPISIKRLKGAQSHADLRGSARKDISLPITLLSTTNMLSYEAPDLPAARQIMAARTSSESQNSNIDSSPTSIPALTPDSGSPGSSPAIEYNHLSAYFPGPAVKRSASARHAAAVDADVPSVPQRVPSHSKREHERLARKRSLRSSGKTSPVSPSSPTMTAADSALQRTSLEMMGVNSPEPAPAPKATIPAKPRSPTSGNNPFSPELEKLNEVAEDFKGGAATGEPEIEDADTIYMRKKGLVRFAAVDYRNEIGFCYPTSPFDLGFTPLENTMGWI